MTSPITKLGLGSGQFSLDQPSSARGRPRDAEARDILSIAARAGVSVLEVGRHSQGVELTMGQLIPKPNPFPALWDRLRALKDQGLCRKIGVSVYASDDPVGLSRRFKPDVVQAPASLLDQRLLLDGSLAELASMGVEVHLRSIFLNGVLFLPPDRAPSHLKAAAGRISRARRLIAEGRSDPLQAALGFALSRPEASAVLVDVGSSAEMNAVIAAAMSPPPDLDWDEMALDDPTALDTWAAA